MINSKNIKTKYKIKHQLPDCILFLFLLGRVLHISFELNYITLIYYKITITIYYKYNTNNTIQISYKNQMEEIGVGDSKKCSNNTRNKNIII